MSYPAPVQLSRGDTHEKVRIVMNNGGENGNVAFEGEASGGIDFTSNFGDSTRSTPSPDQWITFDNSTLTPHQQYVLIVSESSSHAIKWELASGVELSKALWMAKWKDGITMISEAPSQDDRGVESSKPGATSTAAAPGVTPPVKRQESIPITMGFTDSSLTLPLADTKFSEKYLNATMYIELQWTSPEGPGTTKTGLFTVTNAAFGTGPYWDVVGTLSVSRNNNEAISGNEELTSSTSTSSTSATTQATATPATSLDPNASQSAIGGAPSSSGSSGGSSGGLAPGAIAGIVIGSVLGLAFIAFLIWFCLRRRRRRADHVSDGAYGPGHNPHEYLADKETHARVTESPHSPYTDDGQHQHSQHHLQQQTQPQEQHHLSRELHQDDHNDALETAAAAAVPASAISATENHQPPFAPYSEEHASIASRSVEDMTRSGAGGPRSSTPNVNSNVSHLIEDGMTEDEIRRLEEEEMALDAAIEQAGPRRKP
ncbi:hypothetical protein BDP55DRAFT_629947 [Colletotrichum godetiae]|uniref:Uncharacterized protein n=1 Tax=Colletotrichum godetiae TaxID=1209918 RepID=A0AAJ0AQ78_9PEZI|nr:uncharacterized protein BDP55DRAFT_629947 [Colletotrichum godetiae]KAK1688356.1 hypothetical protein BDP55DRAFT_629947 [Colletotrichum godetiae]